MLIIRLATRNLFRQARRNALSMVSIVLGALIIVVGTGLARGIDENAVRGQIDSLTGHVMTVPEDYPESAFRHPVDGAYTVTPEATAWLDANAVAWTPRLIAAPRAIAGRDSMRVKLVGVGERDAAVFHRDQWVMNGTFPSKPGEILVTKGPAKLLDLEVGDVLTLETRTVDGAMNAMRYVVSGTMSASNPVIDNNNVYLPIADAAQLLNAQGRVTHVASLMDHRDNYAPFAEGVVGQIEGVRALTWRGEIQDILDLGQTRAAMFNIMGLAMLMMAATGIANTVLMAAFERVGEIGTLRSMGLQRSGVIGMFAAEGFGMGLVGGLLGAGTGGVICAYYATNGIDMSTFLKGQEENISGYPVSAMLYMDFSPTVVAVGLAMSVVVAVLASIYPAVSASNISPAEAVRPR